MTDQDVEEMQTKVNEVPDQAGALLFGAGFQQLICHEIASSEWREQLQARGKICDNSIEKNVQKATLL